jgi:glycosyltransferase involved in cell wall biosynthesis
MNNGSREKRASLISLKILMLNWRDVKHPDAGGSELHLQEIASRWVKNGHEVSLFSASFSGGLKNEELQGVDIQRIGNKYTVYLASLRRLIGQRPHEYDVIFESVNTVPFFAPLFSRTPVVGQIYSIENKSVLIHELGVQMLPAASIAYLLSSSIPTVYKNCEITTISNTSRMALMGAGFDSGRIHVAYPGLSDIWTNTLKNERYNQRSRHSIVYLGRLKKYKGVQDILYALPAIRKKFPDIRFRIIGKGDYERILRSIVETLGIQEVVEFCGFVTEEEKARILQESSLYVCTSLDEGGWTIAAVEAMSAGVPVLVTKSQLDVLAGGLTGRLLKSSEPKMIADSVISILDDDSLWTEFSKNSLEFSKKFNWDNTASNTLVALKKAVGNF